MISAAEEAIRLMGQSPWITLIHKACELIHCSWRHKGAMHVLFIWSITVEWEVHVKQKETVKVSFVYLFILLYSYHFILVRIAVNLESIPGKLCVKWEYTLNNRTPCKHTKHTRSHLVAIQSHRSTCWDVFKRWEETRESRGKKKKKILFPLSLMISDISSEKIKGELLYSSSLHTSLVVCSVALLLLFRVIDNLCCSCLCVSFDTILHVGTFHKWIIDLELSHRIISTRILFFIFQQIINKKSCLTFTKCIFFTTGFQGFVAF